MSWHSLSISDEQQRVLVGGGVAVAERAVPMGLSAGSPGLRRRELPNSIPAIGGRRRRAPDVHGADDDTRRHRQQRRSRPLVRPRRRHEPISAPDTSRSGICGVTTLQRWLMIGGGVVMMMMVTMMIRTSALILLSLSPGSISLMAGAALTLSGLIDRGGRAGGSGFVTIL